MSEKISSIDEDSIVLGMDSPHVGEQQESTSLAGLIDEFFDGWELPEFGVDCRDSLDL